MSRLKQYLEYKDSGIEWLGKIPGHWKKMKLSRLFKEIGSGGTPDSTNKSYHVDGSIKWINTGDLNDGYLNDTKNKITQLALNEVSTLRIYPKNSLVVAMYGATIGKLAITNIKGAANQACCVLTDPINTRVKFMFYWFLANREDIINSASGGGQPNISQSLIRSLSVFLPSSLHEQDSIIQFLDDKTSEIDALISYKERLIELLEEKRQAVITETVTKGLDPNVKMKDSGVEWIGEIPDHWETVKFKRLIKVMNGKEIENELNFDSEDAIDVYGSGGVFKKTDKYIFDGESVLFGRKGTIGKPIYVNQPFWTVDTMYYTHFYKGASPKWFYFLFCIFPWAIHTTNTALPSLVGSDIENDILAVPSYEEQVKIVDHLEKETSGIFDVISETKTQISKLKEYRESLIYEAVTGKIDVRNYAPETEELH
ncbi:Type I site-specific deoxyribonuclease [Lentibacillus sp. JNUCC-1]|uniref:restriction endonuclease subunit S n=1 Tax=Lentibacillus sp. JNUCC-1 TaxID=2654513 RepID=UPI0012E8CF81|nr:restriction endonuclease subunit S [Lentibacillus sp. JNUCC-1]MUV37808.1 Type I site-specific deoxyribonuclease [Lentibacillus sp. JNUCC-1]